MKPALASCVAALAFGLYVSSVCANGRFPAANQLVINPTDERQFLVRTTFGLVETTDAGKSFRWICEGVISEDGVRDPPVAVTGDGTFVVAVPFEGVAVSHDHGCSWAYAPAPLADQFAVDVTLDPTNASGLLALTSTADTQVPPENPAEYINLLVSTADNARSWKLTGAPLPRDFIAAAFELAPSRPQRIYASGLAGDPAAPVIERSDDAGASWMRFAVPVSDPAVGVFVTAIHPRDPNRLWVRVLFAPDSNDMSPTSLYRSDDGGSNWTEVARTVDSMFGFAVSPDGETLAYGSLHGVFAGDASGQSFEPLGSFANRCLTWSRAGLYACATEPADRFAVGIMRSQSPTFDPLYRLADTCPQECPDNSPFALTCREAWSQPLGIAELTEAQTNACGIIPAMTSAGGAGGGTPAAPQKPRADGCAWTQSPSRHASYYDAVAAVVLIGVLRCRVRRGSSRSVPE